MHGNAHQERLQMNQLLTEPTNVVLAAVFGTLGSAAEIRAAVLMTRKRPWPEAAPMLRPIRAWRFAIFGAAMLLGSAGFAFQLSWLVAFAAILAFVETVEASMMLQALGDEDRRLSAKPATCETPAN
jgi:hypothetical protein